MTIPCNTNTFRIQNITPIKDNFCNSFKQKEMLYENLFTSCKKNHDINQNCNKSKVQICLDKYIFKIFYVNALPVIYMNDILNILSGKLCVYSFMRDFSVKFVIYKIYLNNKHHRI